ncbi:DUF1206 domain-containing protein [Conexibacter sp. JD483]|uniref:DUF1206 domain-containing protein n=1 Tax=unclassified Conexibacter TaxID=2627773 RepID=UPI00272052C8|nr:MULTISPECIES: DUF1206 domain-containing protein [unclassified Conexibacter]MDO8188607.1 DUF1206 domain-containing protein [Conexibacter sp. CPCC 205706]MDO8201497.1 DUF1206 domain-containing protein [Conexibacter sp. CPCC 205762]MDR9370864.1 DUF1206 domain-containing protein [Conexibacter sp. JD483]
MADAEQLTRSRGFEALARFGLVARGVVYAIIGLLALLVALDAGGRATDQRGALATIAHRPFGTALLVVTAIGLAGYALWRLSRALLGHGPEQQDSAADRVAALASGIAYSILCVTAVGIVAGGGGSGGGPKSTTGGVLGWSGGTWLVGAAGVVLIGVAGYQAYKGLGRRFLDDAKTGEMSAHVERAYTALGVFGHVARAVVFALIGYGLIHAAVSYDPNKAIGLDGALRQLGRAAYGPWLLGLVAVGLIGFAAYSIADARYRKV